MNIIKQTALAIFLAATTTASFAQKTWKSDPMHSQLKFDIAHLGVNTVSGAFTDFTATIVAGKSDFSDAKFSLTAQAASVNTGVEPRNNHLKSADFFDVAQYPTITFQTTSLKKVKGNQYKLAGELTMHGVTKPVVMDLAFRGTVQNPMNKKDVAGFRLSGEINRNDFGIGPKFQAPMISEKVTIIADGEFGHE